MYGRSIGLAEDWTQDFLIADSSVGTAAGYGLDSHPDYQMDTESSLSGSKAAGD